MKVIILILLVLLNNILENDISKINKLTKNAEKAFKDTINTKVADALETKRKEVANTFVKSSVTKDEGDDKEV